MQPQGAPLYLKVAATIKSRIHGHTYQPGDWIPPAKELAQEFGVSNITIRKAVEQLIREGYLTTRQGTGTRVSLPELKKVEIQISGNFRDWLDSASGRSLPLEIEILDIAPFHPPQSIRSLLSVGRDEAVGRLRRLRRCRGQIISYFINYFHAQHLKRLPRAQLGKRSFIEVFQEVAQIRLKQLDQRVESVIAEMDLAEMLETDFGSPLFFIENIYHSNQNKPVVVTHMYLRGDRYAYTASIRLRAHDHPAQRPFRVPKNAAAAGVENSDADDHQ
jgi:GntR family transcriptional regulator